MRHGKSNKHLGRNAGHRKALIKNLVKQLYVHESIITTRAKAEVARIHAEKLISLAKRGTEAAKERPEAMQHARRLAASRLADAGVVVKLFDELAPRYAERPGGYTRMLKLGARVGDSAEMVLLELVD